jgi:hypothetical protein
MDNYKKELKSVEEKINKNELTSKEELNNHLMELKNRGILTLAQANCVKEELLPLVEKENKKGSGKRITRTPQSELFDF